MWTHSTSTTYNKLQILVLVLILRSGKLTAVTHLNRFSRLGHSFSGKMRAVISFLLAAGATAQSISYVYTATFTETEYSYIPFTTCPCPTTTLVSSGFQTSTTLPQSSTTTYVGGLILPSNTIAPSSPIPTTSAPPPNGPVPASSTTSSSGIPVVTDDAYIATVLRHHNIHRSNHTANPMVWNTNMASIARQIAETCVYGHVT